jgi:hypothetical protein
VRLADGRVFKGPSCESDAARALLSDGLAPDTRLIFMRDGRPSLMGGVLAFAARVWAGAADDPAFRKWRPYRRQHAPSGLGMEAASGAMAMGCGNPTDDDEDASGAGGAA